MKKVLINYLYNIGQEISQRREKNLIDLLEKNEQAVYLDCGIGNGVLTLEAAREIGTKNIFGIDRDLQYIKVARKREIEAVKGDLNESIPFQDNTFDVITAIEVIEHLHNTDHFLSELYRVLKKEGYAIIGTENLASWHNIFSLILGLQPSTGPHISDYYSIGFHPLEEKHTPSLKKGEKWNKDKHINVVTRNALIKLIKLHGFEILDEKPSGFYPFGGNFADALASFDKIHALTILLKIQKK